MQQRDHLCKVLERNCAYLSSHKAFNRVCQNDSDAITKPSKCQLRLKALLSRAGLSVGRKPGGKGAVNVFGPYSPTPLCPLVSPARDKVGGQESGKILLQWHTCNDGFLQSSLLLKASSLWWVNPMTSLRDEG